MTRSYCSRKIGFCVVAQVSFGFLETRSLGHFLDQNTNPENHAYGPCFLDASDRWDRINAEEDAKEARKASYDWDDMVLDQDDFEEGDCSAVSFPPTVEELIEESRWQYDQEMEQRSRRKAA